MAEDSHLIDFYGTDCPKCIQMEPLIARLESETGLKIKKLEVWHNEENAKLMREYDKGECTAVPFFFNTKTGKSICGSATYEKFKAWALGE